MRDVILASPDTVRTSWNCDMGEISVALNDNISIENLIKKGWSMNLAMSTWIIQEGWPQKK